MKKYNEEKNKIIEKWGYPREFNENYKNNNYIEYIFIKTTNTGIHYKTIWVFDNLIFNKKKDMISYMER